MEYSDIMNHDKSDVVINITYDPSIIDEKKINSLEEKFPIK